MSERTSYPPGTPCWVDLGSPDPAATAAFYGSLFGWHVEMDPRPEAGGYGMFSIDGKLVAGLGPQQNPDLPPFWTVYVSVDDVDKTIAAVGEAGGTTVAGPIAVFDAGRMAVFQDSTGSFISAWQPDQHIGSQIVNEPGTFGWNELATTDLAATNEFYPAVFGWEVGEAHGDAAAIYTIGGRVTCGAHRAGDGEFPAWTVWFTSDDTDASVAAAKDLGATVLLEPNDMGFGRGAVIADPQGAVLGIGTMSDSPG